MRELSVQLGDGWRAVVNCDGEVLLTSPGGHHFHVPFALLNLFVSAVNAARAIP